MAFIRGALDDPCFDEVDLSGVELVVVICGRHAFIGVGVDNAEVEFAAVGGAGCDGGEVVGFGWSEGRFGCVESKVCFAFFGVGAMTCEA